jgi:hypothetical protein
MKSCVWPEANEQSQTSVHVHGFARIFCSRHPYSPCLALFITSVLGGAGGGNDGPSDGPSGSGGAGGASDGPSGSGVESGGESADCGSRTVESMLSDVV